MKIIIETVPHEYQRYETVGDWYWDPDNTLHIKVSETGEDDFNYLIGLHELVEVWLCRKHGINQRTVDEFDKKFEGNRKAGDDSEPGDDYLAPYRDEHCIATGIERIMCGIMERSWEIYGRTLEGLPKAAAQSFQTKAGL